MASASTEDSTRGCANFHGEIPIGHIKKPLALALRFPSPGSPLLRSSAPTNGYAHLSVCEVSHGVQVRGDKLTAGVLVDAQLRVLDLVVVDGSVEAHHHGWTETTQCHT